MTAKKRKGGDSSTRNSLLNASGKPTSQNTLPSQSTESRDWDAHKHLPEKPLPSCLATGRGRGGIYKKLNPNPPLRRDISRRF